MNIWDGSDDEKNDEQEVQESKPYQESEHDKPKILKRKDEKLLELVREQAKRIKHTIENKVFDEVNDIHEKLIKLYPQIEKVYSGKEIPKLYSKSLYLIQKSIKISDEEVKEIAKNKRIHFSKLKKAIENDSNDIGNVIEDYLVDKVSDDELDFEERQSDISDDDIVTDTKKTEVIPESDDPAVRRLKWVKKELLPTLPVSVENKIKKQQISRADEKINKILEKIDLRDKQEVLSDEGIEKEYSEKVQFLGQQNKPSDLVERVEYLVRLAKSDGLKLKLCILLIQLHLEIYQGSVQELPIVLFREICGLLVEVFVLSESVYAECESKEKEQLSEGHDGANGEINATRKKKKDNSFGFVGGFDEDREGDVFSSCIPLNIFQGSLITLLESLQNNLYKSLQFTEYSNPDYIDRLKDEITLITICVLFLKNKVVVSFTTSNLHPRLALVLLSSLYYRKINNINTIFSSFPRFIAQEVAKLKQISGKMQAHSQDRKTDDSKLNQIMLTHFPSSDFSATTLVQDLLTDIFAKLDNKAKVKAQLCGVFFNAINDNFDLAKELFYKANLSELVQLTKSEDIKLLYNRTVVKLGLAAFRAGEFESAKYFLGALCCLGTSRLRDNICQTNEKFSTMEKEEKKKYVPFTMRIGIEEIETAFYLSLMLEDLDKVLLNRCGANDYDLYLKKQMDLFEKQSFYGLPENNRQAILYSCEHLIVGNTNKAIELLFNNLNFKILNCLKLEDLKEKLKLKLKIMGLRCYLIINTKHYSSVGIEILQSMYGILDASIIRKEVNKMILNSQIPARWNENYLEFINGESSDIVFNRSIKTLEDNLRVITENNILLLEAATKSSL